MAKKKNTKGSEAIKKRRWGNQFSKAYTDEEIESIADEMLEWFKSEDKNKPKNLWLKDFAIHKMLGQQRISEFAKQNEYFRWIYNICKDMQESYLFKLGLSKGVSGAMPIFALKNVAGWKDKVEVFEDEGEDNGLEFKGWS